MDTTNEFVFEWLRGDDEVSFTVPSSSAMKTKLTRLAEDFPEDVQILAENADGSVFGHMKKSYLKVGKPRGMSEEQREAAAERMKAMHEGNQI